MATSRKTRLLLTGASGFLGHYVAAQAKETHQVVGLTHQNTPSQPGIQVLKLDIADLTGLRNVVREVRPDYIIHTAAIGDVNFCQQNPAVSQKINVEATVYLAKLAAELAIPFVFTSSDMVFDGKKGRYTEADAPNPLNLYGEQKARAEEGIATVYPDAAVCRMPLMYGAGAKNFFGQHLQKLCKGEELALFTDEYRTPLGGISAARGLLLAMEQFKGFYHLGGPERISRYGFGLLMAEAANIPSPHIKPTLQAHLAMAAPRPADASLDSSKAAAQGFSPLSLRVEMQQILGASA